MKAVFIAALSGTVGLVGGLALAKSSYPPLEVILASGTTIIGQEVKYPIGTPMVTAAIVTMEPGANTGWHHHDAPLFAWVLDGELTVDYGPDGSKKYQKDDAFLEAFKTDHDGTNTGDTPTRILAVFMGSVAVSNTVMRDH